LFLLRPLRSLGRKKAHPSYLAEALRVLHRRAVNFTLRVRQLEVRPNLQFSAKFKAIALELKVKPEDDGMGNDGARDPFLRINVEGMSANVSSYEGGDFSLQLGLHSVHVDSFTREKGGKTGAGVGGGQLKKVEMFGPFTKAHKGGMRGGRGGKGGKGGKEVPVFDGEVGDMVNFVLVIGTSPVDDVGLVRLVEVDVAPMVLQVTKSQIVGLIKWVKGAVAKKKKLKKEDRELRKAKDKWLAGGEIVEKRGKWWKGGGGLKKVGKAVKGGIKRIGSPVGAVVGGVGGIVVDGGEKVVEGGRRASHLVAKAGGEVVSGGRRASHLIGLGGGGVGEEEEGGGTGAGGEWGGGGGGGGGGGRGEREAGIGIVQFLDFELVKTMKIAWQRFRVGEINAFVSYCGEGALGLEDFEDLHYTLHGMKHENRLASLYDFGLMLRKQIVLDLLGQVGR
jgi:hypothetical protein